jgi:predicted component of type VI protein secretion system
MKEKFAQLTTIVFVIMVVFIGGCQFGRADSVNMLLQPDSPTMVSFPLLAASQIYAFAADAQQPIQISLVPITHNLSYTAELRDDHGTVMATVSSSAIQNAVLTVSPGDQHYQVAIKSDNTNIQGMLSMQVIRTTTTNTDAVVRAASVQTPVIVPFQSVVSTSNDAYVPCSASSSTGVSVNLRSGPGMNYGIVGTLVYGTALTVSGQSQNGWYQVVENGQYVWVSASVTTLAGDCQNLPDVTPPNLNTGTSKLVIADNGWGSLNESINSTDANPNDLIVVTDPLLSTNQHYEEFTLTLICSGDGADLLRWGAAEKPTLKCGSSVVLPMTGSYQQQVIAVTLPYSSVSSAVQYTLMAVRRI